MAERGYQLNFSSQHPVQMYDSDLRRQKAEKVLRIIRDFVGETKERGVALPHRRRPADAAPVATSARTAQLPRSHKGS